MQSGDGGLVGDANVIPKPGCVLQDDNDYWANVYGIMTFFLVNWLKQQVKVYKKNYMDHNNRQHNFLSF